MPEHVTTVADVLNLSVRRPDGHRWKDLHARVTCSCGRAQTLAEATLTPAEDPRRISDYNCTSCSQRVSGVVHWGLLETPLPNAAYRLGDYAIDTPFDLRLYTGRQNPEMLFPSSAN